METINVGRLIFGIGSSLFISGYGYKKKALSKSGAIAGLFVGFCSGVFGGYRGFSVLFFFFLTSSLFTRLKSKEKKQIEDGHKKGGQRTWEQVAANGLIGSLACLFYALSLQPPSFFQNFSLSSLSSISSLLSHEEICISYETQYYPSYFLIAYLAHYACCNGDTWASELGTVFGSKFPTLLFGLSPKKNFVICKQVKVGTNGAMSQVGTIASIGGGAVVGFAFALPSLLISKCDLNSCLILIAIGAFSGFYGSLVDSVMGGTLQYSGFEDHLKKVVNSPSKTSLHISGVDLLTNHQVNFLSAFLTSISVAYFASFVL